MTEGAASSRLRSYEYASMSASLLSPRSFHLAPSALILLTKPFLPSTTRTLQVPAVEALAKHELAQGNCIVIGLQSTGYGG